MKVTISKDIRIQNYSPELLKWCQQNLVVDNPDYHRAVNSGRWVGNMEKNFILYEKRGDTLVLPFGTLKSIWSFIKNSEINLQFSPIQDFSAKGHINLYDYQENALQALIRNKNGVLEAPCGSGKTQIGLSLIETIGQKALWLTHTTDLLRQSMDRAKSYYQGDFGTITDGKVDIGKDITFATVQTMVKLNLSDYANEFNVVIVDECHKVAGTPTRLMQFYKVVTSLNARHKFGLSATLSRSDGLIKSTFATLGDIVYTIPEQDIGDKIIQAKHVFIETGIPDTEAYLDFDGTLKHNKLIDYLVLSPTRNEIIIDKILQNPSRNIMILTHRVNHLQILLDMLPPDIRGYTVHGSVSKNERNTIFESIRQTTGNVLFATYALAKEGLDIPSLDMLILATPQKDRSTVVQSVGRIERNFDGKPEPIVFDLLDENILYCFRSAKTRKNILKKRNF